jgi:hypothetical protein
VRVAGDHRQRLPAAELFERLGDALQSARHEAPSLLSRPSLVVVKTPK